MRQADHWKKYIEGIRQREIGIIFNYLGDIQFENGLEIGAGSGFQSKLLFKFLDNLVCTELNENRLKQEKNNNIKYLVCDAEIIDSYFQEKSFDFIFSSNLLEHLPNVNACVKGIHSLLKDDGITIHIMPSPFYAFCVYCLWYTSFVINLKDRLKRLINTKEKEERKKIGNNLKIISKRNKLLEILHFPKPHGVSKYFIQELLAFRKNRWIKEFQSEGFEIINVINGPVFSGLGFGFDKIRKLLEKFGIASEYIFIMEKTNKIVSKR